MKKLEKTPRKNIRVKYYHTGKGGKKVITAQLTDEHGVIISGARATYTMQRLDTEEEGKIAARSRALQKLDELFGVGEQQSEVGRETFFSSLWNTLSDEEKRNCIAERHAHKKTQKNAIKYFENNALSLLDQYGPNINEDQLQKVADSLFHKMLLRKKYKEYLVTESATINVNTFFEDLEKKLQRKRTEKNEFAAQFVNKSEIRALLSLLLGEVLKEERLRSLMENWIGNQGVEFAVDIFLASLKDDKELPSLLSQKSKLAKAVEKLVLRLRVLSGNEELTKNQVNGHLREINCILRNLCLKKGYDMPGIVLPEYPVEKAMQIELCKELEWEIAVRFAALCMEEIAENCYACGGITLLTSGPRIAEVCAIQFGEIVDRGDWGIAMINYTPDGEIRKEEGKNIYFHRPIFFPKLAMDAIHLRKEMLRTQGYGDAEIAAAYIVSRPNDIFLPADPQVFSIVIKEMLQKAGCAEGYWLAVERAMIEEQDLDVFRRPERSLAAYGLRRHATSMMCNIAKMDPLLVDAILGHCLPRHAEDWGERIRRDDEWSAIIKMMERIVYDPDHTQNPFFTYTILGQNSSKMEKDIPYQGYTLTAAKTCKTIVLIKTSGNGEVRYNLPVHSKQKNKVNAILGTSGPCCSLGPLHSREEYEKAKRKKVSQLESDDILDREDDSIGKGENCSH